MKRRFFVTTTGMIAAGVSSGFAATSSMLNFVSGSQLHILPTDQQEMVKSFESDLNRRLFGQLNAAKLAKQISHPVEVISAQKDGNKLRYKNAAKDFVQIEQKKSGVKISIYKSLSDLK